MKRLLPYPLFATAVFVMWILLTQLTLGQVLLGIFIAIISNHIMIFLDPEKLHIKNWRPIMKLIGFVLVDITVSNFKVARIILNGGNGIYTGFTIIPLRLEGRTMLAILACIMTMTPGTAWVSYNSKSNELLLHVLNLLEEDSIKHQIKNRYEKLLLEIFQ